MSFATILPRKGQARLRLSMAEAPWRGRGEHSELDPRMQSLSLVACWQVCFLSSDCMDESSPQDI